MDNETSIAVVEGDGGPEVIDKEELAKFKDEAAQIAKEAGYNVNERRYAAEEVRHNIWEGQSSDGRKHADAQDGKKAWPFEGASDTRIRLADMIINERVLIMTLAALRHVPAVKGLDIDKQSLGAAMTTLLTWVIKNKLGSTYFREIVKILQFQEADSPAVGVMGIWWQQETALEMKTVTKQDLVELLVGQFKVNQEQLAYLEAVLANPDMDKESAAYLMELYPFIKEKRAKLVVKELREKGQAEFPSPYVRVNQPTICAYRLYEDIFLPNNTTDLQRSRCIFLREWLSEVELKERGVSYGYSEEFIDETLKQEAKTAFPTYRRAPGDGELVLAQDSAEDNRGMFEVVTVFFKAVNDDDIPGIYSLPYNHFVEMPAHERKLLDYSHGKYPFVFFSKEILTQRLMDSRGCAELVATDQHALKLLSDSFNDNVTLSTLPNIKVPRRRTKMQVQIGPLILIKEDRPGDVSWMQPPQYPAGNDKQQQEIRRRVNEYFGRISTDVPAMLTQLHQTGMVSNFLVNLTDTLVQLMQLCQQYMSDEDLALITGDDKQPIARERADIQGQFNLELSFDPRDLDMEWLKEIVKVIAQFILPIDTLSTIQRDKLVQRLFMAISPTLAKDTLAPVEQAQKSEIEDEENNFTKINAGIEPQMVKDGLNFGLRLQVLQGIAQKNPEALQKMSPKSREIYQARMEYLQNQVQQQKNAVDGARVGVPALGN